MHSFSFVVCLTKNRESKIENRTFDNQIERKWKNQKSKSKLKIRIEPSLIKSSVIDSFEVCIIYFIYYHCQFNINLAGYWLQCYTLRYWRNARWTCIKVISKNVGSYVDDYYVVVCTFPITYCLSSLSGCLLCSTQFRIIVSCIVHFGIQIQSQICRCFKNQTTSGTYGLKFHL